MDELAEFETLGEGPGNCHVARINEKSEMHHDAREEWVPFISTQAALTTIFIREAEEQVGGSHALMQSSADLLAIRGDAVIIDKGGVREAE